MNLGHKIKKGRLALGLTQEQLVGGELTRNMLSAIENGKATPSLASLTYIAERLGLPVAYLLTDDEELILYSKSKSVERIRDLLREKRYDECIASARAIGDADDEINFILATSYAGLGVKQAKLGSLGSAGNNLLLALEHSTKTVYDTSSIRASCYLYLPICSNVHSPLLEFDSDSFLTSLAGAVDYEFYKYLTLDFDYKFKAQHFAQHFEAKTLIRSRRYKEALEILADIESRKGEVEYNAFFMFGVYSDIEQCYKQLYDFENAYRYSSKRLSLIEGFNS